MFLYIIRHAQSLGNLQQHKTPDDGLSPLGKRQAELISAAFEGIPLWTAGQANAVVHAYELDRDGKVLSKEVVTEHLAPLG